MFELSSLANPIICAPMAGGPSTPSLVSAVGRAGGLGFLAAGYKSTAQVAAEIFGVRAQDGGAFGINLFWIEPNNPDQAAVDRYVAALNHEVSALPVTLGRPIWEDDEQEAKVELCLNAKPAVVSFTFGCPGADLLARFAEAGVLTMITVTTVDEARLAIERGAGSICLQGHDAGGHRGTWDPTADPDQTPLAVALPAVLEVAGAVPVVAAGGLTDAADVRAVLDAGAVAAQLGTAFLLAEEAGTNPVHRKAISDESFDEAELTRAFTGRWARGLRNGFMQRHPDAPAAYPQIHHVTAPWRKAAAQVGDVENVHLWAGTGFSQAVAAPAAEILATLTR